MRYEEEARRLGFCRIAGVDEVGRGPLAGPVVACAVVLPRGGFPKGIRDSKRLSPASRDALCGAICSHGGIAVGLGLVDERTIDRINILEATRLGMRRAVERLPSRPDFLLVDALDLPSVSIRQRAVVRGDALSLSIAASSIVAKVVRDTLMEGYDRLYPGYGFSRNKGYGTREHLDAIDRLGPCGIHRMSFAPLRFLAGEGVKARFKS